MATNENPYSVERLVRLQSPVAIERILAQFDKDRRLLPIDARLLGPYVAAAMQRREGAPLCRDSGPIHGPQAGRPRPLIE